MVYGFVYRSRNAHSWGMCTEVGMRICGVCFLVQILECTLVGCFCVQMLVGYVFVCRSRNAHSWGMLDLGMRIRGVWFYVPITECAFVGYVSVYRSRNAYSREMFLSVDLGRRIRGKCF